MKQTNIGEIKMRYFLFFLLAFFFGSIPFSYIFGKVFAKTDIRKFGKDKNPGATNAFRAGGFWVGFFSLLFDYLKGVFPLYLILTYGKLSLLNTTPLVPFALISIAPVLGHMFTPFLKFRGGKGVDTTFGIWTALTLWEVPVFLGGIFTALFLIKKVFKAKITDTFIVLVSITLLIFFAIFKYRNMHYILTAVINAFLLALGQYKEKLYK